MKFALNTFNYIVHGDLDRRVRAGLTFGLWFVAGAFAVSTLQVYLLPSESNALPVLGGLALSGAAAAIAKLS